MSWFKYDCAFCAESCSIDVFGYHLFEQHFDDMVGTIMIDDDRVQLQCVTVGEEDMFMCAACGFAVKTRVTFDKHLRTKGEEHQRRHLENIKSMTGSDFNGKLDWIDEELVCEIEEPAPKRQRLMKPVEPVEPAEPPSIIDKFTLSFEELVRSYNYVMAENRYLRAEVTKMDEIRKLLNK